MIMDVVMDKIKEVVELLGEKFVKKSYSKWRSSYNRDTKNWHYINIYVNADGDKINNWNVQFGKDGVLFAGFAYAEVANNKTLMMQGLENIRLELRK